MAVSSCVRILPRYFQRNQTVFTQFLRHLSSQKDDPPTSFKDLEYSILNRVSDDNNDDSTSVNVETKLYIEQVLQKDHNQRDFNPERLKALSYLLQNDSHCLHNWMHTCRARPELLDNDIDFMLEVKEFLIENCNLTSKKKLFKLISVLPDTFYQSSSNMESLQTSLSDVHAFCHQRNIDFVHLIAEIPICLNIDIVGLDERCDDLAEFFANKKEVSAAINSCPHILIDYWPHLKEKLNFIIHVMQVSPKTLIKSKALTFDLQHIKDRYEFLNRAGLYQHPSLKSHSMTAAEAYPNIADVVETKDEAFVNDVAGEGVFSVEDYKMFVKMLNEEEDVQDEDVFREFLEVGHERAVEDEIRTRNND